MHDVIPGSIQPTHPPTPRPPGAISLPSQMLCLHVPSLLPHPFADMDTSSVTQAAALAGVGLLYQAKSSFSIFHLGYFVACASVLLHAVDVLVCGRYPRNTA